MILVEIIKLNPVTGVIASKRERTFINLIELKEYYELAKQEKYVYISMRKDLKTDYIDILTKKGSSYV